jgi:hypothetical protein
MCNTFLESFVFLIFSYLSDCKLRFCFYFYFLSEIVVVGGCHFIVVIRKCQKKCVEYHNNIKIFQNLQSLYFCYWYQDSYAQLSNSVYLKLLSCFKGTCDNDTSFIILYSLHPVTLVLHSQWQWCLKWTYSLCIYSHINTVWICKFWGVPWLPDVSL